ncbi:MAG TPA: hypothetical protein PKX03_01845 [Candidatus Paceibacterota bacterium]|nr:hypothetical protein [Parcubacteria group bacterium]HPC37574.1 hypothetical protein [Candidatus Paceibacterota bacterium]
MSFLEIVAGQNSPIRKTNYWWKILLITVFSSIFAILAGLSLGHIFIEVEFLETSPWLMFLIFLTLFLTLFLLESLFANGMRFGSIIIQSLLFTFGFYITKFSLNFDSFSLFWNIGIFLILILCLWLGRLMTRKRKSDLLRLRWNEMAKSGLTLMLIGINLFICLQWMGEIIFKPDLLLTPQTVNTILKPATPIFKIYFGEEFKPEMQIDDFIRNLAAKQVEATFDEKKEELAHVPKATIDKQKKDLIEQNFIILKAQLSKQLEIKLSGNETFELVVFEFLDNVYQKLDVSIKQYIILIITLLMFVALRVVAIFVSLIVRIIGWFFYELFIASGYVAIKYESRNKEDLIVY